jgi:hypothetical protein
MSHAVHASRGVHARRIAGAAIAVAGLAGSLLTAQAAAAADTPTSLTPSLTSLSEWQQWAAGYDYELTTKDSVPALRFSNASGASGNITQLSSPAIVEVGEPGVTDAEYRVFTAEFTIDAADYEAQPGLGIEVAVDQNGNRSGGNVVFRQESAEELTLSTYWADAGSEADLEDWNNDTATVPFTGPVRIRYVVEYNASAPDSVKIYVNDVLTLHGEGFEAYHVAAGNDPQVSDSLLFRINNRVPVEDGAWETVDPTTEQQAALLGHGFYFSAIEYGASNSAVEPSSGITVVPSISGTVVVGGVLTADVATSVIAPTLSYQWLREGLSIPGAKSATYTIAPNDVNKRLSVKVTASKSGYASASATSAKTAAVTAAALTFSTPPAITGTVKLGKTLTAHAATTPGASYKYQWQRNGASIKGATKSTYKLAVGDVGREISVKVTATKAGYATLSATSDRTDEVAPATLTVGTTRIVGTFKVDSSVTARATGWTSGTTLKYAFYADGELTKYSTSSSLKLTWEEKGKAISVIVIGSKPGYEKAESAETSPRGPVR